MHSYPSLICTLTVTLLNQLPHVYNNNITQLLLWIYLGCCYGGNGIVTLSISRCKLKERIRCDLFNQIIQGLLTIYLGQITLLITVVLVAKAD
jgi:hypothetical protein